MVDTLVDTSVLVSATNAREAAHRRCLAALTATLGRLVISPLVLAEADYMIARLGQVPAEVAMLQDIRDNMTVAQFSNDDLDQAITVVEQYTDLNIGITDASIVVLAARYHTTRILTLDHKHFQAIMPLASGDHFTLLPSS